MSENTTDHIHVVSWIVIILLYLSLCDLQTKVEKLEQQTFQLSGGLNIEPSKAP